jgi:hypothetical protein
MSKNPEIPELVLRGASDQAVTFRRLHSARREIRGRREAVSYADTIVSYATEETFTALDTLQGLNIGLWHIRFGDKDIGKRILAGINNYWFDSPDVYKYFTSGISREEGLEQVQQSLRTFKRLGGSQYSHYAGNYDFILQTNGMAELLTSREIGNDIPIISVISQRENYLVEDRTAFISARDGYQEISKFAMLPLRLEMEDPERLLLPERVMGLVRKTNGRGFKSFGHIYTEKIGGVSLKEIDEDNDDFIASYGMKILRYMAGIQKGNVFYQRLADCAFLISQNMPSDGVPEGHFKDIDHTSKVFSFQSWMADMMVLPLFGADIDHREFDDLVSTIIANADNGFLAELSRSVYYALVRPYTTITTLDPTLNMDEAIDFLPFTQMVIEEYKQRNDLSRGFFVDEATHEFMVKYWDAIKANWQQRFGITEKEHILFDTFEILERYDYVDIHTEAFMDTVSVLAGEGFLERLKQRHSEVVDVTKEIWKDTTIGGNEIAFELHPEVRNDVIFSENSFAEIFGFQGVSFKFINKDELTFLLQTRTRRMGIKGTINPRLGEITELSINLPDSERYLVDIIHFILTASYHDLILQKQIVAREVTEPSKPPGIRKIIDDTDEPSERTLPRIFEPRFRGTPQVPFEEIQSDQLEEIVNSERTNRGQKIYKFDAKRIYLSGAGAYKKAVKDYLDAGEDELEEKFYALVAARDRLHKISDKKSKSLPERFKLETIIDPLIDDTERNVVNLQTWRISFRIPKYIEGDKETLSTGYRKYYRGGSALTLLDNLVTWIVE